MSSTTAIGGASAPAAHKAPTRASDQGSEGGTSFARLLGGAPSAASEAKPMQRPPEARDDHSMDTARSEHAARASDPAEAAPDEAADVREMGGHADDGADGGADPAAPSASSEGEAMVRDIDAEDIKSDGAEALRDEALAAAMGPFRSDGRSSAAAARAETSGRSDPHTKGASAVDREMPLPVKAAAASVSAQVVAVMPGKAMAQVMEAMKSASQQAVGLRGSIQGPTGFGAGQGAEPVAPLLSTLPSSVSGGAALHLSAAALPAAPAASPQQLAETAARLLVQSVSEGRWQASLRLDPPDLGRVEVQISRDQGALSAHFITATAGARAAMEQALPQLAQQLSEQGMSLGDASVSQQDAGAAGDDADGAKGAADDSGEVAITAPLIPESGAALRARGLFEGWA